MAPLHVCLPSVHTRHPLTLPEDRHPHILPEGPNARQGVPPAALTLGGLLSRKLVTVPISDLPPSCARRVQVAPTLST